MENSSGHGGRLKPRRDDTVLVTSHRATAPSLDSVRIRCAFTAESHWGTGACPRAPLIIYLSFFANIQVEQHDTVNYSVPIGIFSRVFTAGEKNTEIEQRDKHQPTRISQLGLSCSGRSDETDESLL